MALNFLKTGAASAALQKQYEVDAQKRKEEQGKMWRFFLLKGEKDARITFVDGELSPEGFLTPPRYYEHNLYLNGNWNNFFVCPEMTNPGSGEKCPICESGDRPPLVALFTVIDHRIYTSQKSNKTYQNTRKLLVAKPQSFEVLNQYAVKRGGLTGTTWDVSRIGDKAASIGSIFDFAEKKSVEELQKLYTQEVIDPKTNQKSVKTIFVPADYEKEIIYRDSDTLRKMGLGAPSPAAASMSPAGNSPATGTVDYSTQL